MPRFKVYNYDQNAMVVINYQDQLPGSALAWQKRKGLKHFSEWRRKSLSKQWIASCEKWNKLVASDLSDQNIKALLP
tara:strand:- start:106 stop:336 length:231 start_codon:yes stop_codon:yes gene_type:complete